MIRTRLIRRVPAVLSAAAVVLLSIPAFAELPESIQQYVIEDSVIPIAGNAATGGEKVTVDTLEDGTSSRRARAAAQEALPLNQLQPEALASVQSILSDISLFRRLPKIRVDADRRVYDHFITNPDVAISIWRVMQISQVEMYRTAPGQYQTDTKDGSLGSIQVLHRTENSHLVLCDGQFRSPALKRPIRASALLHLQPVYETSPDGSTHITHTVDLFVSFPSQTFETLARIVSPVSNRIADRNLQEVSLFVEMMDLAMTRQPGWVEQVAHKLTGVEPESPQQLLEVTAAVYVDARKRTLEMSGVSPTLEQITPPIRTTSLVTPAAK